MRGRENAKQRSNVRLRSLDSEDRREIKGGVCVSLVWIKYILLWVDIVACVCAVNIVHS